MHYAVSTTGRAVRKWAFKTSTVAGSNPQSARPSHCVPKQRRPRTVAAVCRYSGILTSSQTHQLRQVSPLQRVADTSLPVCRRYQSREQRGSASPRRAHRRSLHQARVDSSRRCLRSTQLQPPASPGELRRLLEERLGGLSPPTSTGDAAGRLRHQHERSAFRQNEAAEQLADDHVYRR